MPLFHIARTQAITSYIVKAQGLTFPNCQDLSTLFPILSMPLFHIARTQAITSYIVKAQELTFPNCLQPSTHYPIVQGQALTFPL
jgi:hypothetical protein